MGEPWSSAPVAEGPRPVLDRGAEQSSQAPQILFGDLHNHTNYSIDAYVFNSKLVKGTGIATPADACDFARYCSALDFWSINDHAEGLTPRVWADTVDSIRECNDRAGSRDNPDMVSFVGWEWSNGGKDVDAPSHYGHKNVIVRTWEEGQTPTRPIASEPNYLLGRVPAPIRGLLGLTDGISDASDFGWYIEESNKTPVCADGVPADELPDDCREVALTPTTLYRKLDEWGFDSIVIPHGLAWGTVNPQAADFRTSWMNTNSATRSCSRSTPDTVVLNCLWILNGLVSPLPVSPFVPRLVTTLPLAANRRAKSPESVVTILLPLL